MMMMLPAAYVAMLLCALWQTQSKHLRFPFPLGQLTFRLSLFCLACALFPLPFTLPLSLPLSLLLAVRFLLPCQYPLTVLPVTLGPAAPPPCPLLSACS